MVNGISDAAGNAFTYTLNSGLIPDIDSTALPTIDTTAPTLTITSSASVLKAGATSTITFNFTEDPGSTFAWSGTTGDVVVTGGTLGPISVTADPKVYTATFTAGSTNGAASITVAANNYADAAGNNGSAGTSPSLTIDTVAPTLSTTLPTTALSTVAGTAGNSAGETITLTLTFDGAVSGLTSGTNSTVFKVAGTGVSATWGGTTGTNTRTLTYTVAAGQNGLATIDEAALKTALSAGISDAAGNAFSYSGAISDIDAGTKALPTIDTTAPTISSIAFTSATGIQNKLLNKGDTVTVTVTMSEAVNVDVNGELPVVYLNIGGEFPKATYASGTGTSTLRFTYTIEDGRNDGNGIAIGSSELFLGTIKDAAGNDANRDHAVVNHDENYKVDTTAPVFTNTNWSPNIPSGTPGGTTILTATATDANGVAYSLSGTDATYFNIADTGVVTLKAAPSYSTKASYSFNVDVTDLAGNVTSQAATLAITEGPGDPTIVFPPDSGFGTSAQLIKPIQVDGGHWYYILDANGDGAINGSDQINHNILDDILNKTLDTTFDPTKDPLSQNTYTFDNLTAKLATIGVANPTAGTQYVNNTGIGSNMGDNTENANYNDLLAIWDAYNTQYTPYMKINAIVNGVQVEHYWPSQDYWSADLSATGSHYVMGPGGSIRTAADTDVHYAVFEVINKVV